MNAIESDIDKIRKSTALFESENFIDRAEALNLLDFYVMGQTDGLLSDTDELCRINQDALSLMQQFEAIDADLFLRLREEIKNGRCSGKAFLEMINRYVHGLAKYRECAIGYDYLDAFIDGLIPVRNLAPELLSPEPEMVFYQKTPVRIVIEMAERANFEKHDVFYDLGSGLGQVPILVNLLTGVPTRGVEVEPSYYASAKASTEDLNLSGVTFINIDARSADYSDGTVFFMYTPFEGRMLKEVLEKLRSESLKREIRIFAYGPCIQAVARLQWLACADNCDQIYCLAEFISRPSSL